MDDITDSLVFKQIIDNSNSQNAANYPGCCLVLIQINFLTSRSQFSRLKMSTFKPKIISVQEKELPDNGLKEENADNTPRYMENNENEHRLTRRSYEDGLEIIDYDIPKPTVTNNRDSVDSSDVGIARNGKKHVVMSIPPPLPPPREDTSSSRPSSSENDSLGSTALTVKHAIPDKGIQEVSLCKDARGKLGIKVKNIKKGVYAMEILDKSPAANAGIFPGDRILQINGEKVDGYDDQRMHRIFKKQPINENIRMLVNKRPLEKTFAFARDANGLLGFVMRGPRIQTVVKDSPAAIQGLSNEYYIVEVNGKPIRGMKEADVRKLFEAQKDEVKITVMPYYLYEPLYKQISLR